MLCPDLKLCPILRVNHHKAVKSTKQKTQIYFFQKSPQNGKIKVEPKKVAHLSFITQGFDLEQVSEKQSQDEYANLLVQPCQYSKWVT